MAANVKSVMFLALKIQFSAVAAPNEQNIIGEVFYDPLKEVVLLFAAKY